MGVWMFILTVTARATHRFSGPFLVARLSDSPRARDRPYVRSRIVHLYDREEINRRMASTEDCARGLFDYLGWCCEGGITSPFR